MFEAYLKKIDAADVYDVAVVSPLEPAKLLSARLKNQVLFKREDQQPIFSFKLRGAYNKLRQLSADERERGVICSSAGNHAQGVALASNKLGITAVIVMPVSSPRIKVDAVRAFGCEVILFGAAYDDAYAHAQEIAESRHLVFIHPFDDPDVIAGQGTIAKEIFEQYDGNIDYIFVPVGGGGLASGIALYAKSRFPATRIIGVEPVDAASMHAALQAGHPVTLEQVGTFADGVSVKRVGDETFKICKSCLDDIVLVSTDEICAGIQDIFEDTRGVVEPAGALAVAGMKRFVAEHNCRDQTLVAINGGANTNFDRLRHITERAAIGEQREALFAVEIPEKPGSFLKFCEYIGQRSVTEFNYRLADRETARIFVGLELQKGKNDTLQFIDALTQDGYAVLDLSDNEMAKLHIRHMVGGIAMNIAHEHLFRFEFPEQPGALLAFLTAIGSKWNISLFHYRNHGSNYGRVLAGIQVPIDERAEFDGHLAQLGYPYEEETDNPAYRLFLA